MMYLVRTQPSPEDGGGKPYILYPTIDSLADFLSC